MSTTGLEQWHTIGSVLGALRRFRLCGCVALLTVTLFRLSVSSAPPTLITAQTGGRSITERSLQPGDLIVSTTNALLSAAIRLRSGAAVSHVMLYAGDVASVPMVIEAIGPGVTKRPLVAALNDATLAAAFRHPRLRAIDAQNMIGFADTQVGAAYNKWGVIAHPLLGILGDVCSGWPAADRQQCVSRKNWEVKISLDVSKNEFFCSELLFEAYRQVRLPLTAASPAWSTPGDIPALSWTQDLVYIGHLK